MKKNLSSKEFNELIRQGKIKVGAKGKLIANESLFSEEVMTEQIHDDKIRETVVQIRNLEKDVQEAKAVWIPYNVPSSKNMYKIVPLYKNTSTCCKAKIIKPPDSKVVICSQCNKVTERVVSHTMIQGDLVKKYKKNTLHLWNQHREVFKFATRNMNPPYYVGFYLVRDSRRIFDYINAAQVIQDIMGNGIIQNITKTVLSEKWIEDDNMKFINPLFLGYHVDSNKPGIYIKPLGDVVGEFYRLFTNPSEFDINSFYDQIKAIYGQ